MISWEHRKFSDTFFILQNNTLSRAELSQEEGSALNVHYGDILIKYGEILDVNAATLPFIPNEDLVSKFKSSTLEDGDVIIADTAEDETVGNAEFTGETCYFWPTYNSVQTCHKVRSGVLGILYEFQRIPRSTFASHARY